MRNFILAISLLLSLYSSAQEPPSSFEKKELSRILKNKVKNVTCFESEYGYGPDYMDSTKYKASYIAYNRNGRETENITYWPNGNIQSRERIFFDAKGKMLFGSSQEYSVEGSPGDSSFTRCDSIGRPLAIFYYLSGTLDKKDRFSYDQSGRIITEISCTGNDSIGYVMEFSYNNKGLLVEELVKRPDDEDNRPGEYVLERKYVNNYDQKGNELLSIEFDGGGGISHRIISTYDPKGNLLQQEEMDENDSLRSRSLFKYDEAGNETEWSEYDPSGKFRMGTKTKYDRKGLKTKESWFNKNGPDRIIYFQYSFY